MMINHIETNTIKIKFCDFQINWWEHTVIYFQINEKRKNIAEDLRNTVGRKGSISVWVTKPS